MTRHQQFDEAGIAALLRFASHFLWPRHSTAAAAEVAAEVAVAGLGG